MNTKLLKQAVAEFIGTFALIFIGVGAIYNHGYNQGVGLLGIALAHGLTIAVMVSATAGISGGHLNPAVTLGVLVGGKINGKDAVAYWIAQLLGATVASVLLLALLRHEPVAAVAIVKIGTPALSAHVSLLQGIGIEAVVTFFLVFVVYGSAVDARAPKIGGLAIGLTVAIGILFAGPLTGGALNPARWFGPALIAGNLGQWAVYFVGPLLGGAAAGLIYGRFLIHAEK